MLVMAIDIYILNLPRATHRFESCSKELRAREIPVESIHTWVANDDMDYEKTREVCEAAIADGFPKYQSFLDKGQQNACNIAHLTQSWNWCRFFRHLIEAQKTALFIQDDVMLGPEMTYQVLNEMVDCLHDRNGIFLYFTLWIRWFNSRASINPKPLMENPHITRGIYSKGCDMAQVITPQGAAFLLSKFEGYFYPVLEDLVFEELKHRDGFYTLIDEAPFSCRKWTRASTIRLEGIDGFVRPIDTTKD